MKKVLIVDDDKKSLNIFPRLLKPHSHNFEVMTASSAQEAIEMINNAKIDLVLTDLEMPVVDGFKLLAYMSENHPDIPVFVMTDTTAAGMRERAQNLGALNYFEKPVNVDNLVDSMCEVLKTDTKSQIWGISLPAFMQLMEMEKKTCTLTVLSGENSGTIYFFNGEVTAAETDDLLNKEAIFEMLLWENAVIEIENYNNKEKREMNIPLMTILMEGLRLKDEKDVEKKKPDLEVYIDEDNITQLECPECGHSFSALIKKKRKEL